MHFEVLVEDSSGARLIEILLPKILGEQHSSHSWRVHPYKGIGRIPAGLHSATDPAKRVLLDQLPRILRGMGKTSGIDVILVIVDSDNRDCRAFLAELKKLSEDCGVGNKTLFRMAIEEIESWYFGDQAAILSAYPSANRRALEAYEQDSVCGTWETLAKALYPKANKAVRQNRGPNAGNLKHEWADKIGPLLDLQRNKSPSFQKFVDGLRRALSIKDALV